MSIMPNITSALRCLRLLDLRLSGVGVKGEESITGITGFRTGYLDFEDLVILLVFCKCHVKLSD